VSADPGKILLVNSDGSAKPRTTQPYLVMMTYAFRIDSVSDKHAQTAAELGVSFNSKLGLGLIAHGVEVKEFNEANLVAAGFAMPNAEVTGRGDK
jgi:hypothetical protein